MTDAIYTVTVFPKDLDTRKSRTWGWFPTADEAIHAVLNDDADIFECYYVYAVVEEFPSGIFPYRKDQKTWWFHVDGKDPDRTEDRLRVRPCEKPSELKHIIHFGMG